MVRRGKRERKEKFVDQLINNIVESKNEDELYCKYCDREFERENDIISHQKTKNHKKNMKLIDSLFFNNQDLEMAGGIYRESYFSTE